MQVGSFEYLFNVWFSTSWQARVKALLNHIAGELKLAQSDEVSGDLLENSLVFLQIIKLDDVLHKIISIRVLNKTVHVFDDILGKTNLLIPGSLLQASLHNTAAMLVLSNGDDVVDASIKDELRV